MIQPTFTSSKWNMGEIFGLNISFLLTPLFYYTDFIVSSFFQISAKESPDTQTFTCSTQNEGDDQIGTFSWLLDGVEADTATQGKY